MNGPRSEVRARCAKCQATWTVATLPMLLEEAAALMLVTRCPVGCNAKVLLDPPPPNEGPDNAEAN